MSSHKIIRKTQDLTWLEWSDIRYAGRTGGTFVKSEAIVDGRKIYYKLSNYNPLNGIVGYECVNEIIVDRLLTILGVEHLDYQLIHAEIELEGKRYNTYLCASEDFRKPGESKIALDDYYRVNKENAESPYDFCARQGADWKASIDQMIAVDFLILNRDRHGANIEVIRNTKTHTLRLAPLFDHGLSLLCTCTSEKDAAGFDPMEDKKCQNFIGRYSSYENLTKIMSGQGELFPGRLKETDRDRIFAGMQGILQDLYLEKIWYMIWERYKVYENLSHHG